MKIYTLGTSHGHPEPGRKCSGTLLEVNGVYYLFDCGGDAEGKMCDMGLPIRDLKAVFVSHMHEDHAGKLTSIIKRFTVYEDKGEPVEMFLPEENGIAALKNWAAALHLPDGAGRIAYTCILPGQIYQDDHITVRAIATAHILGGQFPSFAFDITAEGKRFLYTGDLAHDFHDYPAQLLTEKFDLVLSECVHFDLQRNFDQIARTKTDRLVFTHIGPWQMESLQSSLSKFPFPACIANDGDCFTL